MTYIFNQIELEQRIEELCDTVVDGKAPCCYCGKMIELEVLFPISSAPDAPAACQTCFETQTNTSPREREVDLFEDALAALLGS